jgi:superfamily II DNA or RNA helicase
MLPITYKSEITPKKYTDRADPSHQDWVKSTFKYKGLTNQNNLFRHQRIVRDYMQINSPYRGILLYHGLGSGKTLSAIAISEIFVNLKKVVVMLPATLLNNFYEEVYKFGNEFYVKQRHWTNDGTSWTSRDGEPANYSSLSHGDKSAIDKMIKTHIDKRITFIKFNGLSINKMKAMLQNENVFANKVVIIDEVQNFISRVVGGSGVCKHLYKMIMDATNMKLVCLSGTPLINYAQEFTLLINLISGYVEKYTLRCKKTAFKDIKGIEEKLKIHPSVKKFSFDHDKNEIYICLMPDKYKKQTDGKWKYKKSVSHDIENVITILKIDLKVNGLLYKRIMTLPLKEKVLLKQMKLLANEDAPEHDATVEYFRDATRGLISYFYYKDPSLFPKIKPMKIEKVDMSVEQFEIYQKGRKIEYMLENKDKFQGKKIKSTMFENMDFNQPSKDFFHFKVHSRTASNYIFPGVKKQKVGKKIDSTAFFRDASELGYLNPSSLPTFAPKIHTMLKKIQSAKGPCLIYSQYRVIEGLGAVAAVLDNVGYSEIKIKKKQGQLRIHTDTDAAKHFIVFSNTNQEHMQILMDIFNKNLSNLPTSIAYDLKTMKQPNVDVILITQSGSEGISLKGVRQVHILEPFWNDTRTQQIIGRAVRAKSHIDLIPEEQNVKVFLYLATMTKEQSELMKWDTGNLSQEGMSTDQVIYEIALRKQKTLGQLLTIMKETSMDCKVHLTKHKKIDPSMKCV